jgi:hypothetical protein
MEIAEVSMVAGKGFDAKPLGANTKAASVAGSLSQMTEVAALVGRDSTRASTPRPRA